MSISNTLAKYLDAQGVDYDVVSHNPTATASETAQSAHVPGDTLAKAVFLHSGKDFLLAVIPATHALDLAAVGSVVGAEVSMAHEDEMPKVFADCALGAVPAAGAAFGLRVVLDEALYGRDPMHFEGGDHETLVRVSADGFAQVMAGAERGTISRHT